MELELYKHNKKAYEKVEAMFEHENHVAIVHATGTGKSFISMKWLFDNKDKRCLLLAPTYEILDQFEEHVKSQGLSLKKDFPNLQFAIYSNLMRKSDKELKKLQIDNIVLDEFHRCGAPEWGKSINKVIGYNPDAKVLGISATPIRYLDNNKNMAEELFHGNIASEITLVDAMADGILPMPTYISAAYSFEEDIERIQDKINRVEDVEEKKLYEEQLKDAKRMLEKSEGLSTVFEKYIPNKEGKYVVFCRDQKHMQQMMQEAKDWLKNVNSDVDMYTVYSRQGRKANKCNLADFNKSKNHHIKLLFSIEMLNEGVHVPDIDGVIMLRPTESKIIYLQQLGRALSVGHNQHPVVFDIVNNIHGDDSIREVYQEVKNRVLKNGGRDAEGREINLDEFKIIDYLQQPNELIDSLNSLLDDASSPEAKCEKIVQAVINFVKTEKRMPSLKSSDKDEANLYSKFNYNKTKFTEEQKQKLIDAGVPASVFLSQEEGIEQIVSDVIDWFKTHDEKMPSNKSNDKDEANLYSKFYNNKTKFTEEQKQRLIDAGAPLESLEKRKTTEAYAEDCVKGLIKFLGQFEAGEKRMPSQQIEAEKSLYDAFIRYKDKFTPEQKERLIEAGVLAKSLEKNRTTEAYAEDCVKDLIKFLSQFEAGEKRMPSFQVETERSLYQAFRRYKDKFTPEQKQRLLDAGVPAKSLEKRTIEACAEDCVNNLIDFLAGEKRMPSYQVEAEKSLYQAFSRYKDKFTPEQKARLIEAGVPAERLEKKKSECVIDPQDGKRVLKQKTKADEKDGGITQ